MDDIRFMYSPCNYDIVTLQDGEEFTFPLEAVAKAFGLVMISGRSEIIATSASDMGRVWDQIGVLDTCAQHSDITVRATGITSWACLSDNGTGAREFAQANVTGTYSLPAGWGFIVISGSVMCDGLAATANSYFRPRETVLEISGTGLLVLVK